MVSRTAKGLGGRRPAMPRLSEYPNLEGAVVRNWFGWPTTPEYSQNTLDIDFANGRHDARHCARSPSVLTSS